MSQDKRILHLTLKKEWFDKIASGEKKIEYRDAKPYWIRRLKDKEFDEVHFRNGYSKDSPFMRVEYLGKGFSTYQGRPCIAIELGRVLEVRR